jgi:hypothetical protein
MKPRIRKIQPGKYISIWHFLILDFAALVGVRPWAVYTIFVLYSNEYTGDVYMPKRVIMEGITILYATLVGNMVMQLIQAIGILNDGRHWLGTIGDALDVVHLSSCMCIM